MFANKHSQEHHSWWPKCPLTDMQINTTWSTHTTEYYSATKRNKALTQSTDEPWNHDAEWQMSVNKRHRLHDSISMKGPGKTNPQRQKTQIGGGQGWRNGKWQLKGTELPVRVTRTVWNRQRWWLRNIMNVLNGIELLTLKWCLACYGNFTSI